MTRFANTSGGPARVAFSAPYPGKILALRLDDMAASSSASARPSSPRRRA